MASLESIYHITNFHDTYATLLELKFDLGIMMEVMNGGEITISESMTNGGLLARGNFVNLAEGYANRLNGSAVEKLRNSIFRDVVNTYQKVFSNISPSLNIDFITIDYLNNLLEKFGFRNGKLFLNLKDYYTGIFIDSVINITGNNYVLFKIFARILVEEAVRRNFYLFEDILQMTSGIGDVVDVDLPVDANFYDIVDSV